MAKTQAHHRSEHAVIPPLLRFALLCIAFAIVAVIGQEILRVWWDDGISLHVGLLLTTYVLALAATIHYFVRGVLPVTYAAAIAVTAILRYLALEADSHGFLDLIPLAAGIFALALALTVLYFKYRR